MAITERARPPVDLDVLATWMYERGVGAGPITNVRKLGGRTQNIVLQFTQSGRDYVLRRPRQPRRDGDDDTMRREAHVLAALAGSAVPHPRLIAACPDDHVLGAAFYLMEPVDGHNPVARAPDVSAQHAFGMAMVDALLALAAIDVDDAGLGDLGRRDSWLEAARYRPAVSASAIRQAATPATSSSGSWLPQRRICEQPTAGVIVMR